MWMNKTVYIIKYYMGNMNINVIAATIDVYNDNADLLHTKWFSFHTNDVFISEMKKKQHEANEEKIK